MFERFTDRARRAVVAAQEEARMLGHNHIGSEHLLLGLLHDPASLARRALDPTGITLEAARAQVEELAGPGGKALSGHIPFTQRAKKILELSLREALEQQKGYIGTEHLLLGLIRDSSGGGAQILERLGGSLSALRQRVIEVAEAAVPPDPNAEDEGDPASRAWSGLPGQGFPREGRGRPQTIISSNKLLEPIDRRLAGIERHLGIDAGGSAVGGFSGLLRSLDRRVGNIERHLGIVTGTAEPPEPSKPSEPPEPGTDAEAE
jgi:ATP-dependent Clp protease ATP-binding subunit ClpC